MTDEVTQRAQKFWDDCFDTVTSLHVRWLSECQYEDIADYAAPLKSIVERHSGVTIVKMNKRPFGFTLTIDGRRFQIKSYARKQLLVSFAKAGAA